MSILTLVSKPLSKGLSALVLSTCVLFSQSILAEHSSDVAPAIKLQMQKHDQDIKSQKSCVKTRVLGTKNPSKKYTRGYICKQQ